MSAPAALLLTIKDLVLLAATNLDYDNQLNRLYDEELVRLSRETDAFVNLQPLDAVAKQNIYQTAENTTRVIAAAYKQKMLDHADATLLAFFNPKWMGSKTTTPKFWVADAIPASIQSPPAPVNDRSVLVTPAPAVGDSGAHDLTLIVSEVPTSIPGWVGPYLVFRVVSRFALESPETAEPEKGAFFAKVADMFLAVAREKVQI